MGLHVQIKIVRYMRWCCGNHAFVKGTIVRNDVLRKVLSCDTKRVPHCRASARSMQTTK